MGITHTDEPLTEPYKGIVMRTIELTFYHCDLSTMVDAGIPTDEFFKAVGYLSTWGASGYDNVVISITRDCEITAIYSHSAHPDKRYVIGGIWHGEHYGFHS